MRRVTGFADHHYHDLLGAAVEREAQRFDIGLCIHVDVQGRLRHRQADVGPK